MQFFAEAVHIDKPKTTDLSKYRSNGSNNRHANLQIT